jgi:hypothetical protein
MRHGAEATQLIRAWGATKTTPARPPLTTAACAVARRAPPRLPRTACCWPSTAQAYCRLRSSTAGSPAQRCRWGKRWRCVQRCVQAGQAEAGQQHQRRGAGRHGRLQQVTTGCCDGSARRAWGRAGRTSSEGRSTEWDQRVEWVKLNRKQPETAGRKAAKSTQARNTSGPNYGCRRHQYRWPCPCP